MKDNLILKISLLLLILVVISSMLVNCVDVPIPDYSGTSSSTTTIGGIVTTTKPTTTRPTTTTPTTSVIRPSNSTTTGGGSTPEGEHADIDKNGLCDDCGIDVVETIDFYSFNDLHGKFEDTDSNPGVDELTTYLENRMNIDEHTVFLSVGDMWQGGGASNATHGRIVTDWMNELGFEAMALGNHEFDWGTDAIKANVELADFPILAINIYDDQTGQRADFCEPSVLIERGGAQIGIIGAIGDCYSSISSDKTTGISFKTGSSLTSLVKAESEKLREAGADIIVYLIHDGTSYRNPDVSDYYDETLSREGYVDIVFGGHTHSYYLITDSYGVPHLQGGGDNSMGITHVEVDVNFANGEIKLNVVGYVQHDECENLEDSPIIQELLNKYWDEIGSIYEVIGYNSILRNSSTISSTVAKLYYEAGLKKWGDRYDIVLAGGSINTRSPNKIYAGDVTYGDLQMVLPFDNPLYLCKIKGSDLKTQFFENTGYTIYSTITASQVKDSQYYYIIADGWTANYYWAKCTVVEQYDETTFARDFLAQFIKDGGWSN